MTEHPATETDDLEDVAYVPLPKCGLCDGPGHRDAACPHRSSPTPLLSRLMSDIFG